MGENRLFLIVFRPDEEEEDGGGETEEKKISPANERIMPGLFIHTLPDFKTNSLSIVRFHLHFGSRKYLSSSTYYALTRTTRCWYA